MPGVIPERVCQPRRDTRFVHIDNDYWQDLQTSDRAITVWNLMMMADIWSWEIHRKISLDDLWAQTTTTLFSSSSSLQSNSVFLSSRSSTSFQSPVS